MGWTGLEINMEPGMLFRRMYCSLCGTKLKRHLIINTYKKGERGYKNTINGAATIGMDKIKLGYYVYKCPSCGDIKTYEEQLKIAKEMKKSSRNSK